MNQNNKCCLEIEAKLSKHNFLVNSNENNTKLEIVVKPSDELRKNANKKQGVHFCIVIDKSHSMKILVDNKEATPTPGIVNVEGNYKKKSKTGKSRLIVALEAAINAVEMMEPEDTMSCIIFADDPVILFQDKTGRQKEEMKRLLDYNASVKTRHCGLSTNITAALNMAEAILKNNKTDNAKKIIFLTDGEPTIDTKERGIKQAESIADSGITLDCIGFGSNDKNSENQANFSYLQALAAPSKGKSELIYDAKSINTIFVRRVQKTQEVVITDVKLHLAFSGSVRVTDHYRSTPENTYLGKVKMDKKRRIVLNLGQIEKNQAYKYFIQLNVPGQKDYLGDFIIMKAAVEYKIPTIYGQETLNEMKIIANKEESFGKILKLEAKSVSDSKLARDKDADIEARYMLTEVKRFEAESEIASKEGDKHKVINIYKKIIQIYTNLQKINEATMYEKLLDDYVKLGKVNITTWNKITSTTSQSVDTGVLTDLSESEYKSYYLGLIDSEDDI